MRPRINTKVNVQDVIDHIERRVKVYTECIKDIMYSEQIEYHQAKRMLELRIRERIIFKTN